MNQLKMQNKLRNQMENAVYPSVMARAGAFFLDTIIFLPFGMLVILLQARVTKNTVWAGVLVQIFNMFFSNFYRIFFAKKIGGTPGKLICKFKIVKADGAPVTWSAAIKREIISISVDIIFLVLFYAAFFTNMEAINTFADASAIFSNSIYSRMYSLIMPVVYWFDYGKARSSSKRQTLHDKIAGTVVVYKYVTL